MTVDLKELERLARAAEKLDHNERAEWYQPDDLLFGGPGVIYRKNAEFIAYANPSTVLSLIAELTRPETTIVSIMRAELEQARKDAERYRWLQPALISGGALDDDHTLTKAFQHMTTIPTKEEFNAAIDAAIAKEQTK